MNNIYEILKKDLLSVQNPCRYSGGEFHFGKKASKPSDFHCAICFPDLYEIGMSNHAVRILYDILNRIEGVSCDRVFSVAHDFEKMLREKHLPLYTLDEGLPLRDLDLLCISIGYELCATNILQVLDLGGMSIDACDRKEEDPLVICGGPASTNPLPFSRFVDFAFIGEAENGLGDLVKVLMKAKSENLKRSEKIGLLKQFDFLWYPGKALATKNYDVSFTANEDKKFKYYVVPNFKVAQDNGIVEIMRGCPNGCRFCNAGQYYKPYRQKSLKTIMDQVEQNVHDFGFREITLSSLSSGDYPHIKSLIHNLNSRYRTSHISFSLPSLKVSSFNLDVLEQLSEVRKSGLTFAIETPLREWQQSVNKIVDREQIIDIIFEAKSRGWRLAKFYFMIGLPFVDREIENQAIVDFLGKISDETHINLNINVGTFIPKPHTPFQWAVQLTVEQSYQQLSSLKKMINERIKGCKVSYHEPYVSYLEGMISRGDIRYGAVIKAAYEKGCRLDAWDEFMQRDLWQQAIEEADYDPSQAIYKEYDIDEPLPWDSVSLRVGKQYLKNEYLKAKERLLTNRCTTECDHACGVCTKLLKVVDQDENQIIEDEEEYKLPEYPPKQVIFTYKRFGKSLLVSHINAMRNFEMSFQRSGLLLQFTQGFNPKPKLEFVNPLSLGFIGENEVMLAELLLKPETTEEEVRLQLQDALNEGYEINEVLFVQGLERKETLAKYMKGSIFTLDTQGIESYDALLLDKENVTNLGGHLYEIRTLGETNLVRSLFGPEADKFKIAGEVRITRKRICAGSWDEDYISFFKKKMEREKEKLK